MKSLILIITILFASSAFCQTWTVSGNTQTSSPVNFSWTVPPVDATHPAADNYHVQMKIDSGVFADIGVVNAPLTSFTYVITDNGGHLYTFQVVSAIGASLNGPSLNLITVNSPIILGAPPSSGGCSGILPSGSNPSGYGTAPFATDSQRMAIQVNGCMAFGNSSAGWWLLPVKGGDFLYCVKDYWPAGTPSVSFPQCWFKAGS